MNDPIEFVAYDIVGGAVASCVAHSIVPLVACVLALRLIACLASSSGGGGK